jgi:hypothetical protein
MTAMRKYGEPRKHTAANAWGRDTTTTRTAYVVEEADVGRFIEHFGGYRNASRRLEADDVGRIMERITDGTSYRCWHFGSVFADIPDRVAD